MSTEIIGEAKVLGPDEGRKASGSRCLRTDSTRNLFNDETIKSVNKFSIGTQTVAPRSFIREHTHDRNEEIIFVVEGKGIARVDGVDHPIEKGSCVLIGHHRKHHFLNPNDEPLTFLWLFPAGRA